MTASEQEALEIDFVGRRQIVNDILADKRRSIEDDRVIPRSAVESVNAGSGDQSITVRSSN